MGRPDIAQAGVAKKDAPRRGNLRQSHCPAKLRGGEAPRRLPTAERISIAGESGRAILCGPAYASDQPIARHCYEGSTATFHNRCLW